ncbi:hypothetical protein Tsubulata_050249 [Turnera subulata]|uniref:PGG domain-containing protein n=1 Tax=Turnera subulata TaxID=218843 RepID=A0A9Q0GI12_9ROSI|nr:hypothetical protein Tsubulata_050249 [Turnera subulata]
MATPTHVSPKAVMILKDLGAQTYQNWKDCMTSYMQAQDLWDIMEEPRYPDQQAFQNKDWRKKNAEALLAIKTSCAPEVLPNITNVIYAKAAWDLLASKQHEQMSGFPQYQPLQYPVDDTIPQLSIFYEYPPKLNYQDWSTQMTAYLIAKDVWYGIIEFFPDEPNNVDLQKMDYQAWRDKNATALQAIQASCVVPHTEIAVLYHQTSQTPAYIHPKIGVVTSARAAWEILAKLHQFKQRGIAPLDQRYMNPLSDINVGHLSETTDPPTPIYQPNLSQSTLISYQPKKFIWPLASAITEGDWEAISAFIKDDPRILTSIISTNGGIPIHEAANARQTEIARRFMELMSPEDLEIQTPQGHTPLHYAAFAGSTTIARLLVQKNKKLLQVRNTEGGAIPVVAASVSGYEATTRYLYNCTPIELLYPEIIDIHPPAANSFWNSLIRKTLGLKRIYEMKLNHIYATKCIDRIYKEMPTMDLSECREDTLWVTLFAAVKNGIEEIVTATLKLYPSSIIAVDTKGRDLLMLAIASRQEKIFDLMLQQRGYSKANTVDNDGNNTLHWAGMPPPPQQLARISGAALQMQRERQWFKAVESIVQPSFSEYNNIAEDTPRQTFTKHHEQLRKDGEQWMKETATSCTVVGALIITMMFAAAFTVPGGNSDDGLPLFQRKKAFITFIISDAISLFSSSTSVLMFLGILTSRYAEDDFLKSLPKKLIIGLSTLFVSIAAMMVAFCASIIIMLHGRLSVIIPVCLLAGIPVSLFVILQFPLLVEIYNSTYAGIFSTKSNARMKKKAD